MDVDLERGDLFVGSSSTDAQTERNAAHWQPTHRHAQPQFRRPASVISSRSSESLAESLKTITRCNCEGSKTLRILPFIPPQELGLSKINTR